MPQIADRKSMARYICVDKGATHPALQREELPKHMAIYADYGVTGTDLRQRPELNRLLTDCRAGRVNCIVVQSTTHLARRTADLLTILQELQSLGITTDFEKERFSTNSPTGKKMLDTLRAMSASIQYIQKKIANGIPERFMQSCVMRNILETACTKKPTQRIHSH